MLAKKNEGFGQRLGAFGGIAKNKIPAKADAHPVRSFDGGDNLRRLRPLVHAGQHGRTCAFYAVGEKIAASAFRQSERVLVKGGAGMGLKPPAYVPTLLFRAFNIASEN